jgi:XRE family transcriptional regulator of biofilm formation
MTIRELGFRIRRLRDARGLSQSQLAKRAGVSQAHISEVEAGQQPNPGIVFVERVATALHVSVGDLLDPHGQATVEIGIFARFAQAAKLKVPPGSIVKRPPREPDIRCETPTGPLAVELVQLIEPAIARQEGSRAPIETRILKALEVLPGLGDASVYIDFREDTPAAARQGAIPLIVDALRRLEPGVQGYIPIGPRQPIARTVRRLHIGRLRYATGPLVNTSGATAFADPPILPVAEHLRTAYESDAPMELLVYYAAQPVIPVTWSHPALRAFITTELEGSPFRRVWVYDLASDSILWVHPSKRRG